MVDLADRLFDLEERDMTAAGIQDGRKKMSVGSVG